MRLHTNNLTPEDLQRAATVARVDLEFTTHGSRSAARAFNVTLTGESKHRQNMGGAGYAATWDQWGVFLGALYDLDDTMTCWAYSGMADFDYKTGGRFSEGWPADAHGDHRWVVGVPFVQTCSKCSAAKRWGN